MRQLLSGTAALGPVALSAASDRGTRPLAIEGDSPVSCADRRLGRGSARLAVEHEGTVDHPTGAVQVNRFRRNPGTGTPGLWRKEGRAELVARPRRHGRKARG